MKSKLLSLFIFANILLIANCFANKPNKPTLSQVSPSWETHIFNNTLHGWINDIAKDAAGNLYQAGHYQMDLQHLFRCAWLTLKSRDNGNTWEKVDDFNIDNKDAVPQKISIDQLGQIYIAGTERGGGEYEFWTLRKSFDGGHSWNYIKTAFRNPFVYGDGIKVIEAAPNGDLYAGGLANNQSIIHQSVDGGKTWKQVDAFDSKTTYEFSIQTIQFDVHGNIYAIGTSDECFFIRKSEDSGKSWFTFGTLPYALFHRGYIHAATFDQHGYLYIAARGGETLDHWLVLKVDLGGRFSIIDDFVFPDERGSFNSPNGIIIAKNGTLFVTGTCRGINKISHGITRMSLDDGKHWETIDDFIFKNESGKELWTTEFRGLIFDKNENVIVTGSEGDSNNWFTRKLIRVQNDC